MKFVADDKIPFLKGALEPYAEVIYLPGKQIDNKILKDADALLIRTRTICNEELLRDTKVRFIGTATIGFDHIDTQFCDKKGIFWTNAPGCNSSSVQQYITSALLKISGDNNFNLKNKTLGIIGVGNVGSKVEKIAETLGMRVLLNDPPRVRQEGRKNFLELNSLLSDSDILTVHVPLNQGGDDKTYHLFDENNFSKMKRGAWFINSSRGEVVNTGALKMTLKSGKIAGAVIDVWENEPDIDKDLMQLVQISTPHIAGYSTDGKANGTAMVVNSLSRYFKLPSENWYPLNVPIPDSTQISINCKDKSDEAIIKEAVFYTYNIDEDMARLRQLPADFEKLRGDYPLRREFTSYTVELDNGSQNAKQMLESIGFNVKR
jgi:erythronate-4-phosphate dehydrogenase